MAGLLSFGDSGGLVLEVQHHLRFHGHNITDQPGDFGISTQVAVRKFQDQRGLRVDGIVGPHTWADLIESFTRLGDRILYFRWPPFKGDDVAELQQLLNRLGFYAGREDGILGQATSAAITDFQKNAGLAGDGICGPAMIASLHRLNKFSQGTLASLREAEGLMSTGATLANKRIFLATSPELGALGELAARAIVEAGAIIIFDSSGNSDSLLAHDANRFQADITLGLRLGSTIQPTCYFFKNARYSSLAGQRLAHSLAAALTALLNQPVLVQGKSFPFLRETQMMAVICELGGQENDHNRRLFHSGPNVAEVIVETLSGIFS